MLLNSTPLTSNRGLLNWVQEKAALFQAEAVHWCSGSEGEFQSLCDLMTQNGTALRLNHQLRPNSLLVRTDPRDATDASNFIGERTFVCARRQSEAGPTNNWHDPMDMKARFQRLFAGAMRGRTLFVAPFALGPRASSFERIGVQLTDSPYVVASLQILTRLGQDALDALGEGDFMPCLHSVGYPLLPGESDVPWPCDPDNFLLAHFPEERQVWSYGSAYGDNALLSRKSVGLRLAGALAREEGWLAEHMLVLGISNPQKRKMYLAAAFPPGCGKTNLAMLHSSLPGWKVSTISDDMAWLKFGVDERLYAVNPERGLFGVTEGTSENTNPHALQTIAQNTIFTNVALTADGDVWWDDLGPAPLEGVEDWQGQMWQPECGRPAAHPQARFLAPLEQCPVLDNRWNDPDGVPLAALVFGARRATTQPLVYEAFNWQHGIFTGAIMASETIPQDETVEQGQCVRRDPFALRRFCGYHLADYFGHWLRLGRLTSPSHLPRVFAVNWFRTGENGALLWPGFGANMRVLQWIWRRVHDQAQTTKTAAGLLPAPDSFNLNGLQLPPETVHQLFTVAPGEWRREAHELLDFFEIFGDRLPDELRDELENLIERLHPKLEML